MNEKLYDGILQENQLIFSKKRHWLLEFVKHMVVVINWPKITKIFLLYKYFSYFIYLNFKISVLHLIPISKAKLPIIPHIAIIVYLWVSTPPLQKCFFVNPHLKVRFFSEPPKYWSFSSLIPSYLLKVTEFLVKISQFKFLAMTEKNNFAYKLSCHYIFQILIYFVCKNCTPLKKLPPSFPATPSKSWGPAKPPAERGVHTMAI